MLMIRTFHICIQRLLSVYVLVLYVYVYVCGVCQHSVCGVCVSVCGHRHQCVCA